MKLFTCIVIYILCLGSSEISSAEWKYRKEISQEHLLAEIDKISESPKPWVPSDMFINLTKYSKNLCFLETEGSCSDIYPLSAHCPYMENNIPPQPLELQRFALDKLLFRGQINEGSLSEYR